MKTLDKLFGEVINTRGIYKTLGLSNDVVRSLRKTYNDGGGVSAKKMREVLQLAGYKKVQEEMWEA